MRTENPTFTKYCSLFVILLSLTALAGWQFNQPLLRQLIPNVPPTTPLTAFLLLCLSSALFQLYRIKVNPVGKRQIWIIWLLAGTAVLISLFTAVQYLFNLPPSLELIPFSAKVQQVQTAFPGRPSPHTAVSGFLYGLALFAASKPKHQKHKYYIHLVLVGTIVPWIALFGYITLTDPFYTLQNNPQTGMSPITAFCYLILTGGILAWRPDRGVIGLLRSNSPGGRIARLLLPFTILLTVLFGWGIQMGGHRGWFEPTLAFSLSWGLSSLGYVTLILLQGFRLHHEFQQRQQVASEREKVLLQFAKEEEKSRTLLESAPDALVIVDEKGLIEIVNKQAEFLFQYQREDLINKPIEILLPERDRPNHASHRKTFFASPKARPMGTGLELFGRRQDGTEFPVEVSLNTLKGSDGTLALATIRDVTKQKAAAEALRQFNTKLEARAEQMTAELRERNQEIQNANAELQRYTEALEQSNIELQQFAYIASHDLQTPLRSISGFVQLLQQAYQDQLDDQANEWIDITVENTVRMQTIIRDILAYSRVESPIHSFEKIDLNEVFYEVRAILNDDFAEKKAEISSTELPIVIGNHMQLVLLLQNLVGNGIKYNNSKIPKIHASAQAHDKEWIISIQDNGIGIDPAHFSNIFEIFHRLHTQDEFPGNGIGLGICRRVIEKHGGRIWIESEPDQGSTFYFSLPKPE